MLRCLVVLVIYMSLLSDALSQGTNISAPAYDKCYTQKVLNRSVYYLPAMGAVYRERFEVQVANDPRIRGVVIHNHGCGGLIGWETHVAQFYYRRGFAVVTPDFVTRPGNKLGCPGGDNDWIEAGKQRFREGIYTARNSARLDARTDDVAAVLEFIKTLTKKPVFLSGHSEGARTVYHWNKIDPQVRGAILHNQSCSKSYAHLWRLPTVIPTWQVLEDQDPAAEDAATGSCGTRFPPEHAGNFTFVGIKGNSHNPLTRKEALDSLNSWLDKQMGASWTRDTTIVSEVFLDSIQMKLYPEAFN